MVQYSSCTLRIRTVYSEKRNKEMKPMHPKVQILSQRIVFDGFFQLEGVKLSVEGPDGSMHEIPHEVLNLKSGDAVAILAHVVDTGHIVLINQFRYATIPKGDGGGMIEIPAGMIDADERMDRAAVRELHEETGFLAQHILEIGRYYPSVGRSDERVTLVYVPVRSDKRTTNGGGLPSEGEFILPELVPISEALEMLNSHKLMDGKTIMALQWLQIQLLTGKMYPIIT